MYSLEVSCYRDRVPRSLLPSIRSSRLKDRLKEERELLVKRAFIKDVLKENRLLNVLSENYSAFRAVLWHPDLLPALFKESLPETGTTLPSVLDKDNEVPVTAIKDSNHDGLAQQLASYVETVNDSCNSDLSCDFQVDSGALPCVTCGILGYPLMSVIQPSMKAAAELFPAEHLPLTEEAESCKKAKSSHLAHLTKQAISVTNIDETWHTSGLMRPRIFCLEHAVQVKELLRPKGGAKMLVVCHSDYEKIRINAATVAEEIRTEFNYKEVPLDSASKEELSLIDAAIDGEQFTDCQGDWTSKLGMNLRYSVKVRAGCPSKKIGDLNSDYLLSLVAPGSMISNIKWCSRKSRSRRESNNKKHTKLCGDNHPKMEESISEPGSNVQRTEKVLLHYSRRKHRARSKDFGAKCASTCGVDCSLEVTNANCGKIDACEQKISGSTFVRVTCLDSAELHTLDPNEDNTLQLGADEIVGGSVLGNTCTNLEVRDHGASKMSEIRCSNERQKYDISPGIDSTVTSEVTMPTFQKENCSDSCQISPSACSFQVNNKQDMDRTVENVEVSSLKMKKRVNEAAQADVYNEFVRSPCEGLRPRKRKEGINTSSLTEQKLASKMTRKSLRSSISDVEVIGGEGPYKCNLEGCHMCFRTKAEHLLHKRNKCHYEACRKRFRSHRYLVLHQRVHDDKRPLECTWKGCGMTFKWAWARTEHLRLHTGERPYQCKAEGCGRTFRFVSDFSRHRRKMGHYVNSLV